MNQKAKTITSMNNHANDYREGKKNCFIHESCQIRTYQPISRELDLLSKDAADQQ